LWETWTASFLKEKKKDKHLYSQLPLAQVKSSNGCLSDNAFEM
jgi:hypothetical protein